MNTTEQGLDVLNAPGETEDYIVNMHVYNFFLVFNCIVCGEIIGILGIVGNICNIWNFCKQGLTDSITVTLTALSLSDLGGLVIQQGNNILFCPYLTQIELNFVPLDLASVFFFYPQGYFIRVSGLITAFATFERCMSVAIPLRVKSVFTKRLAVSVNISIFLILLLYVFPISFVVELAFVWIPETNRTMFTGLGRSNTDQIMHVSYLITDLALPYFTFLAIVVCNVVITVTLKTKAKWRTSVSGVGKRDEHAWRLRMKERKTVVMLVTVSVIFIACLIPHSAMLTALSVFRGLKFGGPYFQIACVVYSFTFLMETINCSVSCIIYYKMSTKYRVVAQQMFRFWKPKLKTLK
uniref:G-protein coupled receptors family 1 profile domain-containing protein n=1 Tax=Biomphalaria glabrata TaxID=6526 RepID=A0A2C9KYQ7_BIOGL